MLVNLKDISERDTETNKYLPAILNCHYSRAKG